MRVVFNTTQYVNSHGHEPRGRGTWAFFGDRRMRIEDAIWSPSMTYTEAKAWMRKHPAVVGGGDCGDGYIEIFVGS